MTVRHALPGESAPSETRCVPVFIPDHPDYLSAFLTAIEYTLLLDRWWERDAEKTALIVRRQWFDRTYIPLREALLSGVTCEDDECEFPFWDEYTRSPAVAEDCDEPDSEAQENFWTVADWIITGFLAVTATPGAAITYQTLAPRVRILVERRTLGAVADFFVNGVLVSSVDTSAGTAGSAGELIENVIDISELVGSGAVPDSGGAGNIIQLVRSAGAAAAAAASVQTMGEFNAQQSAAEPELAVVTGNITYENTGDNMTAEIVADGIELYQKRICDCIGGGSGESGGGSGESGSGSLDIVGGGGITGEASTAAAAYGEVFALVSGFNDAIFDMDTVYANLYDSGADLTKTSADRFKFQEYVKLVYLVNGEPRDPAQGDPETGLLYEFATHVWNHGGVLGGFAGGLGAWRDAIACRELSLRGVMAKKSYQVLTGTNLESMLLMIQLWTDEQFSVWAGNGVPNENWTALSCAPQYIADLALEPVTSRQQTNAPDWRARNDSTLIQVTFSGQMTTPEGGVWDGLWFVDSAGKEYYKPLDVLGTYTTGYNGKWRFWDWEQPRPGLRSITAVAPTGDNQYELDNSPVAAQIVNTFVEDSGTQYGIADMAGTITLSFQDKGEV